MAPLPKRRMSKARQGKRRFSINLREVNLVKCANCGKLTLPHQVCKNCGTYKGTVLIAPKIKTKVTKVNQDTK
jgi:large subunit ribosomal protein L32